MSNQNEQGNSIVVTRFAPSPTGYLHIGSVRTALFSYLYAKKHQGKFLLRIEDTDRERSTQEAVQVILDGLAWLGLEGDEPPIYQTHRFGRYQAVIDELIEKGYAYRCDCSKERLEALRQDQSSKQEKPRYDGYCRNRALPPDTPNSVVRFKTPLTGVVQFQDAVKGAITIANQELDDLVLQRSDGVPTYNLCVVVDDIDSRITHVIRGDDHINNTPKQIHLYEALGQSLPIFAHIPMILGGDGKRLSKRHGAVSVLEYREAGFLPQALLNALVRLGWSHGDTEIFSLDDMIHQFDLSAVNQAPACFNHEKLCWLNQHYLKSLPIETLTPHCQYHFDKLGISIEKGPSLGALVPLLAPRSQTLVEFCAQAKPFFEAPAVWDASLLCQHISPVIIDHLQHCLEQFEQINDWSASVLHDVLKAYVNAAQLKFPQIAQPIRIALTGTTQSPAIDQTLAILGRSEVLSRLRRAIASFKQLLDTGADPL